MENGIKKGKKTGVKEKYKTDSNIAKGGEINLNKIRITTKQNKYTNNPILNRNIAQNMDHYSYKSNAKNM